MLGWELLPYFIKISWLDGDGEPRGAGKETLTVPTSALGIWPHAVEKG